MSFADATYLPFLALVVAAFQLVPARGRRALLLAASLVFYFGSGLAHGALLLASIAIGWGAGLGLSRARAPAARSAWLAAALVGLLGLLAVFKYAGLAARTLDAALGLLGARGPAWVDLALPLGISFYTFQGLGYVIDVHQRKAPTCASPLDYALYVGRSSAPGTSCRSSARWRR
jgi:D-alanyl-lipoteichoic acid acyltransferase DltB (MBOAT superfamily)